MAACAKMRQLCCLVSKAKHPTCNIDVLLFYQLQSVLLWINTPCFEHSGYDDTVGFMLSPYVLLHLVTCQGNKFWFATGWRKGL